MLRHDEHFLPEAKEKLLSGRINQGGRGGVEGGEKKRASIEETVNLDKFRRPFSTPWPEILLAEL